jgi:hypothetical protein
MRRDKGERGEVKRMSARGPSAAHKAAVTLRSSHLTTCRVRQEGHEMGKEVVENYTETKSVAVKLG